MEALNTAQIDEFTLDEEFFENFTSEHTRKSYQNDIEQFFEWLYEYHDIEGPKQVARVHVIKFRNWLSEVGGRNGSGAAPKTVARKLAAISSYFDFLVEKNLCLYNPHDKRKKAQKRCFKTYPGP